MLFRMVEKTCARLDALDVARDAPKMMRQIRSARPERDLELDALSIFAADGGGDAGTRDRVQKVLADVERRVAEILVARTKESGDIARGMVSLIRSNEVSLHVQVGLVVVLLYFIDPNDLVPDNAEGGYGFIDDSLLLRAGLLEVVEELPLSPLQQEKHADYISMFASVLPPGVVPVLEKMVIELQGIVRVLRRHPADLLSLLRDQIISTGHLSNIPAIPRDLIPPAPGLPSHAGHWRRGVYIEGRNLMVPGGPSLIDGRFYP